MKSLIINIILIYNLYVLQYINSNKTSSKSKTYYKGLLNNKIFDSIEKYKNKKSSKSFNSLKNTSKSLSNKNNKSSSSNSNKYNPAFTNTASVVESFRKSKPDTLVGLNRETGSRDFMGEVVNNNSLNTLGPGSIYWQGWVKFFVYNNVKDDDIINMKGNFSFFTNTYYRKQLQENKDLDLSLKINDEYVNIPDETSFYMTVFDRFSTFSLSRKDKDTTIFDSFLFSKVNNIVEKPVLNGGVIILNDLIVDNSCIRVGLNDINNKVYLICLKDKSKANYLSTKLKDLRIAYQRLTGQIVISKSDKMSSEAKKDFLNKADDKNTQDLVKEGSYSQKSKDNSPYWTIAQGWSSCSLKCGGGTMTLHRICVKPNGTGQCKGQETITKKCNIDPCPGILELKSNEGYKEKTAKPIVRILPFSKRYQSYTKCVLKEQDALWIKDIKNTRGKLNSVNNVMMPVRLIMNNQTLTVMEGVSFDKAVHVFNLEDTEFFNTITYKNCFTLKEESMTSNSDDFKMIFCPFGLSSSNNNEWINEWDYDFNLFKHQCQNPRLKTKLELTKEEEEDISRKLNQKKIDILKDKEKRILEEQEDEKVIKEKEQDEVNELKAIEKEFKFEELLEKEEEEKEQKQEEDIMRQIEKEKDKRNCLLKRIKEKEIENQYNLVKLANIKGKDEDKEETKKMITIRRAELIKKLADKKKLAERRSRRLKNELKTVKYQIKEDIEGAYKDSGRECKFVANDLSYCKARFFKEADKFMKCKEASSDKDEYCTLCCYTEYGGMLQNKRQECYNNCIGMKDVNTNDVPQKWFVGLDLNVGYNQGRQY